jgi:hypothetical protein
MLKTENDNARSAFRAIRKNEAANEYISFIHRNFPKEEFNQYTHEELRDVAKLMGIESKRGEQKIILLDKIRNDVDYMRYLRMLPL